MPKWRNRQTRWSQTPVGATSYRFDPGLRHQRTPKSSSAALLLKFSSGHIPDVCSPPKTLVHLAAEPLCALWLLIIKTSTVSVGVYFSTHVPDVRSSQKGLPSLYLLHAKTSSLDLPFAALLCRAVDPMGVEPNVTFY